MIIIRVFVVCLSLVMWTAIFIKFLVFDVKKRACMSENTIFYCEIYNKNIGYQLTFISKLYHPIIYMCKSAKPSQFLCHETGKNFFLEHTFRTRFFSIFIPYIIRGNSSTSENGFVTPF